jgi:Zn-dependent protease
MAQTRRVTRGWVVGRVLGARVILQWQSLFLVVLLSLSSGRTAQGDYTASSLALGVAFAGVVILSLLLHEFAHALVGRAFRREIREIVLTLMGAHTSFDGGKPSPLATGLIAAAGPATNAALAVGAYAISVTVDSPESVRVLLAGAVVVNKWLAIFNALPGIPMDGGKVLEAVVWGISGRQRPGIVVAAWGGRVVVIGLVAYVALSNFGAGQQPSLFSLMWTMFLVSFLWPASTAALRSAGAQESVDAVTVLALMRPAIGIRYDVTVAAAVREATQANAEQVVVLSTDGHAAGHFSVADAREVPEDRRDGTGLAPVTIPLPRGAEIRSDLTGRAVLEHVREWWGKTDAVAVMDDAEVVGLVLFAEVGERLK